MASKHCLRFDRLRWRQPKCAAQKLSEDMVKVVPL